MKKLFVTTALVGFLSVPVFAETADKTSQKTQLFDRTSEATIKSDDFGFVTADKTQMRASDLIGSYIYNGVGDDAESIGDVNDILLTNSGSIAGVIVGVGGFLGIGEKDVAISIDKLSMREGGQNQRWIVINYSREELEQAPQFETALLDGDNEQDTTANAVDNNGTSIYDENVASVNTPAQEGENQVASSPEGTETGANDAQQTASSQEEPKSDDIGNSFGSEYQALAKVSNVNRDKLIGMEVQAASGEGVGEVNEVLMDKEGGIEAIIVGVGGFLGSGEKDIAISPKSVAIEKADGEWNWSVAKTRLTKEQLENHPNYTEASFNDDPQKGLLVAPTE